MTLASRFSEVGQSKQNQEGLTAAPGAAGNVAVENARRGMVYKKNDPPRIAAAARGSGGGKSVGGREERRRRGESQPYRTS